MSQLASSNFCLKKKKKGKSVGDGDLSVLGNGHVFHMYEYLYICDS